MANREKTFNMCLDEMFRRVGRKTSESFLRQDRWYMTCSWTQSEETDFKDWMVNLLRRRHRWPKLTAQKEASWFLLSYSWRYVPEDCMAVYGPRSARGRRLGKR